MTDAIKDLLAKSAQSIDAAALLLDDNYVDFPRADHITLCFMPWKHSC